MHILIATTGAMQPGPIADLTARLVGAGGSATVMTVVEVPRSFLDTIRSEAWHPLTSTSELDALTPDGNSSWGEQEDASIARYVEERGRRHTEPVVAMLESTGVPVTALYVEGEDPAMTISEIARDRDADVVILGATRRIFAEHAWESVSARVMVESGKPVLVVPAPGKDTHPAEDDET